MSVQSDVRRHLDGLDRHVRPRSLRMSAAPSQTAPRGDRARRALPVAL